MIEMRASQPSRFVLNGLIATAVHYGVLVLCLQGLGLASAGIANTLAAGVGVTVSFLGSRHFVFRRSDTPLLGQMSRFWLLYVALALIQGGWLFLWTDLARLDYRVGFLVGILFQAIGSYVGGSRWVFSPRS
jgi:putative flippase GtrA